MKRREFFKRLKPTTSTEQTTVDPELLKGNAELELPNYKNIKRRVFLRRLAVLAGVAVTGSNLDKIDLLSQQLRERNDSPESSPIATVLQELQKKYPHVNQGLDRTKLENDLIIALEKHAIESDIPLLDLVSIILAIGVIETGLRNYPRAFNSIPLLLENHIARDSVKTIGIFQSDSLKTVTNNPTLEQAVDVGVADFINRLELYEHSNLVDQSYSDRDRITFAVADYNAGRGSSWRAGIQKRLRDEGFYRENKEQIILDGRFGPLTYMALEAYLKTSPFDYQQDDESIARYLEQALKAKNDTRLWWTIMNRLQVKPILPTVEYNQLQQIASKFTGEPTNNTEYVEQVMKVYDFIIEAVKKLPQAALINEPME